jgi:hypothetical protein
VPLFVKGKFLSGACKCIINVILYTKAV